MNDLVRFQTINCRVTSKMYEALAKKAQAANLSTTAYVTNLLLAAYAAKCGPTGDKAMEDAVNGAVAVMTDTAEIDALKARVRDMEAGAKKQSTKISHLNTELKEAYAECVTLEHTIHLQGIEIEQSKRSAPLAVPADTLVKAVVIGFGTGLDSTQIAERIGLSEAFVSRTLNTWRDEIQSRKAA